MIRAKKTSVSVKRDDDLEREIERLEQMSEEDVDLELKRLNVDSGKLARTINNVKAAVGEKLAAWHLRLHAAGKN